MALVFNVQGSSPEPYVVRFDADEKGPYVTCTCAAGHARQACKHRIALIAGEAGAVVDADPATLEALAAMVKSSPLQAAMRQVEASERKLDTLAR